MKVKPTKLASHLMLAFGSTLLLASAGQAQSQTTQLDRVEVTGSSIKRVQSEGILPVTTFKREDIDRTGATTAQDLVAIMPAAFGGAVVANNVGATGVASTAALRGLNAKYTLVLLNGRRLANYAFGNSPVDLNSIPVSAIERVEVLRDGASAVYGADAVAGVINFILRKDYKGLEATAYATSTQDGGGETKSMNLSGGFGDLGRDRFNVFASVNSERNNALKATKRPYADTAVREDLGINKASPRNGIPNLNFKDSKGNIYGSVGGVAGTAPAINPLRYKGCEAPEFGLSTFGVPANPAICGTDYVKFIDLIPKNDHDNLVARAVFQAHPDHQLFAELTYTRDKVVSIYSPAPYTKNMSYPAGGRFYPASITIPKGVTLSKGYVMPDGSVLAADTVLANDITVTPVGALTGPWRTVAGGGRTDLTDTKNTRLMVGAKGTVADWDYELGLTSSKNKGEIAFGPGKFSYAKLTPLLNSGEINVFGPQDATSQAALNGALLTGLQQDATSTAKEVDLRVSKEVAQWTHGPVGLALGASWRKEELRQKSYPILETGDEVGGSGPVPSVTGDRKVTGLFAEVVLPVYKDTEINVAARQDSYKNGFGTSFSKLSPKIGLKLQPSKTTLVRGSYGTGYRAPTLFENLRPFTSGNNTAANFSDPIRCPEGKAIKDTVNVVGALQDECNVQLNAATAGNPNLKPEESKQYSLGFVFQPFSNMSGSIDYWNIEIKNAIQGKSEIQVMTDPNNNLDYLYRWNPQDPANWCKAGDPNSADVGCVTKPLKGSTNKDYPLAYVYLPYDNASKFFAAGLDFNLNYRQKFTGGAVSVNFDGTYYTKHGYKYFGRAEVSDVGQYMDYGPVPRWRHVLTASVNLGTWFGSLTQNYTGGYNDFTDPASIGPNYPAVSRVPSWTTFDTQLGYKGIKNLELVGGIRNLTNEAPVTSRVAANFQVGYDATLGNPLGRVYYVRAKYKFF